MFSRIDKLKLAPKEREVIRLASDGLTDKQIASRLSVAAATLKTYWARIRTKLNAVNRVHAVARALGEMFRYAQVEAKLRETASARLVESNILGFLVLSPTGRIEDANGEFQRMIGATAAELYGKSIEELSAPECGLLVQDSLAEVKEKGMTRPLEIDFIREDGTRVATLFRLTCYGDGDEACVAYVLDRSEKPVSANLSKATDKLC